MKTIQKYLAIGLLLVFSLFSCKKDNASPSDKGNQLNAETLGYLANQVRPLNPATLEGFENFSLSLLQNYEFIFTGEFHGTIGNYQMDFAMIKQLNELGWLDYYSPEMPYSFCWLVNQFLESGDTDLLDDLFRPFRGTLGWSKEHVQHYINIYNYNKTLPADKKIKVVGLEVEHAPENALRMMHELIGGREIPVELNSYLSPLNSLFQKTGFSYRELNQLTKPIEDAFGSLGPTFIEFFGSNWSDFKQIIELSNRTYEAKFLNDKNQFFTAREALIFQNFQKFHDEFPEGNWYGQWGSRHIHQHLIEELESIAHKLDTKDASPIKGKILSIAYIYQNSSHLKNDPYRSNPINNVTFKRDFELLSLGPFTLVPLNLEDSPFRKGLIWPMNSSTPTDGVTTDYFQYLVLMDGTEAASPIQ